MKEPWKGTSSLCCFLMSREYFAAGVVVLVLRHVWTSPTSGKFGEDSCGAHVRGGRRQVGLAGTRNSGIKTTFLPLAKLRVIYFTCAVLNKRRGLFQKRFELQESSFARFTVIIVLLARKSQYSNFNFRQGGIKAE